MKKTFGFLVICATLALLSLPVFASRVFSGVEETLQDPCSGDGKAAIYAEFYKEIKADQAKAYESAKKYVACPADTGEQTPEAKDAEAKRLAYLKDFIAKFEKARRKDQLIPLIDKKDYPGAFELGKQIFADDPNYLKGYMRLGLEGAISQNPALANDTITYAQKAIEMIESGKAPDTWAPFDNKDDALAKLNYAIGSLKLKDSPDQAIPYLLKAASYNSKIKQVPLTYAYLAEAYDRGPYAKQIAEYEAKYKGKDETPESKLALENINQIIDREIDAYARAVALAGNDPNKAAWMTALTDLYKFRHKSDAGLNEMIAGILSQPLPPVPTPITSLPTPPATTPAGSSTSGSTPPATNTAAPTGTQPATGAQPKATATPVKPPTPASTTKATPIKPRTRKAHVRH
jgi:hypothetical protein